ncbi:MAG: hypothetical protein M0Z28_09590 [Rhodospirillales bacterium]|nr:hypothetical protein [Rhodospirillales bacterium]
MSNLADNIFGPLIPAAGKPLPPYYGPVGTETTQGMQSADGRPFDPLVGNSAALGMPMTASHDMRLTDAAGNPTPRAENAANMMMGFVGGTAPGEGVLAHHATWEQFDKPDFSKLGESTHPNVAGMPNENWAMNLAKSGFWTAKNSVADKIAAPIDMQFLLNGNMKNYRSLDSLEAAIRKAGGPNEFRDSMIKNGYSHAKVKDEEMGTTSFVTFNPNDILRKYGLAGLTVGGGAASAGNVFGSLVPAQGNQ